MTEPKTNLALVLAVAFVTALGSGLAGSLFKPFNALWEKDAQFAYVDSGPSSGGTSIILKNTGNKTGVVKSIRVNGGKEIKDFFSSHTTTDLKLRKNEFQMANSLVCPAQTYCEIVLPDTYEVKKLEISFDLNRRFDELEI